MKYDAKQWERWRTGRRSFLVIDNRFFFMKKDHNPLHSGNIYEMKGARVGVKDVLIGKYDVHIPHSNWELKFLNDAKVADAVLMGHFVTKRLLQGDSKKTLNMMPLEGIL